MFLETLEFMTGHEGFRGQSFFSFCVEKNTLWIAYMSNVHKLIEITKNSHHLSHEKSQKIHFGQHKTWYAPKLIFVSQNINMSDSAGFIFFINSVKINIYHFLSSKQWFSFIKQQNHFFLQEGTELETTEICVCIIMHINLLALKGLTWGSIREKFITPINSK